VEGLDEWTSLRVGGCRRASEHPQFESLIL
jgi:hypothetical protein